MQLIAVVGPDTAERAELLHGLGRATWAAGPALLIDAPGERAAWAELRRVADSGTTVITACERAEEAGPYAHRMVLLPHREDPGCDFL
jgi:hypothetical protein